MRLSVFYASAALAATLVLSACSSGTGTQAVPGASQSMAAPMGHHGQLRHLMPVGFNNNDGDSDGPCTGSNPALFYCYYMYPGTSFSQEFAELDGSGNYIPGTWKWHSPHYAKNYSNGHNYNQIVSAGTSRPYGWNPYKGNPSTNTISVSASVAPSNGNVLYYMNVSVCSPNSPFGPGYCDEYAPGVPWQIGIVVLSPSGS